MSYKALGGKEHPKNFTVGTFGTGTAVSNIPYFNVVAKPINVGPLKRNGTPSGTCISNLFPLLVTLIDCYIGGAPELDGAVRDIVDQMHLKDAGPQGAKALYGAISKYREVLGDLISTSICGIFPDEVRYSLEDKKKYKPRVLKVDLKGREVGENWGQRGVRGRDHNHNKRNRSLLHQTHTNNNLTIRGRDRIDGVHGSLPFLLDTDDKKKPSKNLKSVNFKKKQKPKLKKNKYKKSRTLKVKNSNLEKFI